MFSVGAPAIPNVTRLAIASHLRWVSGPNEAEPSAHTGGTVRKLIAAAAACAASLALAAPAIANQAATKSDDLAGVGFKSDSNEAAVEGITLDDSDLPEV